MWDTALDELKQVIYPLSVSAEKNALQSWFVLIFFFFFWGGGGGGYGRILMPMSLSLTDNFKKFCTNLCPVFISGIVIPFYISPSLFVPNSYVTALVKLTKTNVVFKN